MADAKPTVDLGALLQKGNTLSALLPRTSLTRARAEKTNYASAGAATTVKTLDPAAVKAMEKVWNDCGGNYDKMAEMLGGLKWKDGAWRPCCAQTRTDARWHARRPQVSAAR